MGNNAKQNSRYIDYVQRSSYGAFFRHLPDHTTDYLVDLSNTNSGFIPSSIEVYKNLAINFGRYLKLLRLNTNIN